MIEDKPLQQVLRQGRILMRIRAPWKQCITNNLYFYNNYHPQSGEVGQMEMERPSNTEQTITAFSDQTAGWTVNIASQPDTTMDLVATGPSTLSTFLNRPVRLGSYSWAVAAPLFEKIDPWTLWVNDPYVREKLAHYSLLRCKLHIKVVISGTGFHYGRALVGYNPWKAADHITVTRNFLEVDMVQLSQKPSFFLNPSTNQGGEMILPFFYSKNYVSLPEGEYADLGEIYIKSFQDLRHANGGDDPVRITLFAWAEDVVLTMPTSQYTAQAGSRINSGDEYGRGIVSSTASAIAEAAGALKNAPMIGPYARATEICARATADTARIFGYSRAAVIDNPKPMKPYYLGNMANTDMAEAVNKLTLDSKQELTIDSRTVGLDGMDHMDLKSIVTRQSYLTQFTWSPTTPTDTLLWNTRVGPSLHRVNGVEIHPTPMAMIQALFEKWQGSIKFRFQIVKSAFHKGRLLIRWDPRATSIGVNFNTVYSRVIDIAEEDDFEIEVGWGQSVPFLRTDPLTPNPEPFGTSKLLFSTSQIWNGMLDVLVLNPLVSPASDSDLQINVFVSMGDDFKFGGPTAVHINKLSLFPGTELQPLAPTYSPQSGILPGPTNDQTDKPTATSVVAPIAPTGSVVDRQAQVFFGESVVSLRELFRRYVYYQTDFGVANSTNFQSLVRSLDYGLPKNYGWDPLGPDTYTTGNGSFPATLCMNTPLNFMMPCYAGWRGSLRQKLVFHGGTRIATAFRAGFGLPITESILMSANDTINAQILNRRHLYDSFNGMVGQDTNNNACIEVEIPYYNALRMSPARIPSYDFNNGSERVGVEYIQNTGNNTPNLRTKVFKSFATGEDFTLFFFVGCPILYEYDLGGTFSVPVAP